MSELRDVGRSYFPSTRRSRLRTWGGWECQAGPGADSPLVQNPAYAGLGGVTGEDLSCSQRSHRTLWHGWSICGQTMTSSEQPSELWAGLGRYVQMIGDRFPRRGVSEI